MQGIKDIVTWPSALSPINPKPSTPNPEGVTLGVQGPTASEWFQGLVGFRGLGFRDWVEFKDSLSLHGWA